jgi:hypothetical protein
MTRAPRSSLPLLAVRYVLPAVLVVAGLVVFALDPSVVGAEGAVGLVGAGLSVWLFGWLYRKGVEGEVERDEEEAAREFLDEHGRWPSDAESAHFARHGQWPGATPRR